MKKILIPILITLTALACNKPMPQHSDARYMFNADGLQVITSFANRQQQTMSIVYGNAAAQSSAAAGNATPVPGAVFKLVVYQQRDNKFWYGSYINGALQSIEMITCIQAGNRMNYTLEQGLPPVDSTGHRIGSAARIAYILSHKPSVFP